MPTDVAWKPQGQHPLLPLQVLDRGALLKRIAGRELAERQRTHFHQLVVATSGAGTHIVDFEPLELRRGTIQRIHPGQVQQYVPEPAVEARMVIWPWDSHSLDPESHPWFPGSDTVTRWHVDEATLERVLGWVDELAAEQQQFDGSERRIALMRSLLRTALLRLALELASDPAPAGSLPEAYLRFRAAIEQSIDRRPTVTSLAREIGYSTRTLDRACATVTGQTAKQVLDERIAFEVRRQLTHSDRPMTQIASNLGFDDPSNFSKFVKRRLGQTPGDIRDRSAPRSP